MTRYSTLIFRAASIAAISFSAFATQAMGAVEFSQVATIPTYATTLNFDEAGGPTGAAPQDSWASIGISSLASGAGDSQVSDFSTAQPWIGSGNANFGSFGHFIKFDPPISQLSFEAWSPDGAPGPFGGGLGVGVYNGDTELLSPFIGGATTPSWTGVGDAGYSITTTEGTTITEIRLIGDNSYIDNLSFGAAAVPEPASFGILAMGAVALLGLRRRNR